MENCHCGNQKSFNECCSPYLEGVKAAPNAESLLRSRYSAFVTQNIPYIFDTHHLDTVGELDREDTESWAKDSTWNGLEIISVMKGKANDDEGVIEFKAKYHYDGEDHVHHERSHFVKDEGHWFFREGAVVRAPIVRESVKTGRNEPCPCGSGKKFKRCCA